MPGGNEWLLIFITVDLLIIPKIFYIIALQKTLETISFPNRKMSPGNVWLLLIPFFSIIWHFIVVNNIADSIRAEADNNGVRIAEERPGYNTGLIMCIADCLFFIPMLNIITWLVGVVFWIIYWNKILKYKNKLIYEKGVDVIGD